MQIEFQFLYAGCHHDTESTVGYQAGEREPDQEVTHPMTDP